MTTNKNPFDLTGRVALVTGGNGGIGLAMAEHLADAGAHIAIWGQNEAKNAAALARLARPGRDPLVQRIDVGDPAQVEAGMAELLALFGRLDGCFANAGIGAGRGAPFHEMTDEVWDRVLRVNLDGVFYTFRAALRHMVARAEAGDPFGRLVVTASMAAIHGVPRGQHYAASKAAVIAVTNGIAVEYARHGITANAILPGWIETEMTEGAFGWDKFAAAVKPRIPARRWGQPADFGPAAVYFMSPASAYHTGDAIRIDGAYTLF